MQKQTLDRTKTRLVDTSIRRDVRRKIPVPGIQDFIHKKKISFFLTLAIFLLCLCQNIRAQSPEEMRMLELFYDEKDLVITPTHFPKPIYEVAENITVIYSEDIEAMNAHTVAEVLRWIPGIFINTSQDFGATSLLSVQGSEDRHATVLLDGIRWNNLSGGNAETITIPVGVIDRIEVIKGPASSTWGSSLGGVVNIITKTANGKTFQGMAYGSYGKASSLDARAEVSGSGENFDYYLFAGRLESDGLLDDRDMDNISFFSKFNVDISEKAGLNFTFGFSEPDNDLGSFPSGDIRSNTEARTTYANASLDIDLAPRTMFTVSGHYLSQDSDLTHSALGLGMIGPAGSLFQGSDYQNEILGTAARLVWEPAHHTLVIGAEINQGNLDQTIRAGDLLQMIGAPALAESQPDILSWAVFINDTLSLDRWAVTPGVRLDHNTVSGFFFSPSLGVTYQPRNDLLFRGTISRGFHYAPLGYTEGGGFGLDPNPDLKAEEVWSYQVGFETTAVPRVRVKSVLFLHDLEKALIRESFGGGPPNYNDLFINSGGLQRKGVEVDLKTEPFKNISFEASGIHVHFDQPNSNGATEIYAYNIALSYDNPDIFTARFAGHFEDLKSADVYRSNFDDIIWDLNVSKVVTLANDIKARFLIAAHNLFDGNQYNFGDTQNPGRWFEGGIEFAF